MSTIRRDAVNRQTGTRTLVIDNRDGHYDNGGPPWYTECDEHSTNCGHYTLAAATAMAAAPADWCELCHMIYEIRRNADLDACLPAEPRERYATMLTSYRDPHGWDENTLDRCRASVANLPIEEVKIAAGIAA